MDFALKHWTTENSMIERENSEKYTFTIVWHRIHTIYVIIIGWIWERHLCQRRHNAMIACKQKIISMFKSEESKTRTFHICRHNYLDFHGTYTKLFYYVNACIHMYMFHIWALNHWSHRKPFTKTYLLSCITIASVNIFHTHFNRAIE